MTQSAYDVLNAIFQSFSNGLDMKFIKATIERLNSFYETLNIINQ